MDLSLLEFLFTILLISADPVTSLQNLATDKTVAQSTDQENANIAIDGMPVACADGNYVDDDPGCTYTRTRDPWWRIDLGSVYYITSVSICYNGTMGTLYLLSDDYDNPFPSTTPVPPAPTLPSDYWTERRLITQSSNFVNLNYLPVFEARHLALYKSGWNQQTMSIREIWINGYTQADLNQVEINVQSFPSSNSIDFTIIVRHLDLELFGNVRMWLYSLNDMEELSSALVTSMPFQWNTTDSSYLSSDVTYDYQIQFQLEDRVYSSDIPGLEKSFNVSTLCYAPNDIVLNNNSLSQQTLVGYEGQRLVSGELGFYPPWSGCGNQTLTYTVTTNPAVLVPQSNSVKIQVSGLQPYTNYSLTVKAANVHNLTTTSNSVTVRTIEGEPWDGPEDISLVALNQSCARLSWSKPPRHPNGNIKGYWITCTDIEGHNIAADLPVRKDYCDRPAGSKFTCTVSAYTSSYDRDGKLGKPTDVTTTLDQEVEPRVSAYALSSSCIKFKYEHLPYVSVETLTGYQIICSYGGTTKHTVQPMGSSNYIWCSLPPATTVVCTLAEQYASGTTGGKVKVNTTTLLVLDVTSVDNEEITEGSDGVYNVPLPVIKLGPSQGEIKDYLVILYSADSATKRKRSTSECPYNIDKERAQHPTFDPQLPYAEAEKCQLDYYLAARLDVTVVEPGYRFPVGDDKVYGGVHNVPLEKGTSYAVYYGVNATVEGETAVVVHILEEGAGTITVAENEEQSGPTKRQKTTIGMAIGLTVLSVAVIVVVVLLFIRWKCKQKKKKQTPAVSYRNTTDNNNYTAPLGRPPAVTARPRFTLTEHNGEEGAKPKTSRVRTVRGGYENCPTESSPTDTRKSEAIPVSQLQWYIDTSQELILEQFEKLKDVPIVEAQDAMKPENKVKCRYKNLYPGDKHRVLLDRLPSQGTDFINASYVMGYSEENRYIASQGPTEVMVEDFWFMTWQKEVLSIVMATKAVEVNKVKCLQYWPEMEGESLRFGEFTIENVGSEFWADYVITQLRLRKGRDQRWIIHYQFITWPDHDVPETPHPFLTFWRKVARQANQKPGPIIIHCSAGVGRTGAIIALDYLLAQAKFESQVDPYKCIQKMRKMRPFMIQTEEQYVFVHEALYDAISTEGFLTLTNMLPHKMTDETLLMREYQYIEHTLSKVMIFSDSGKAPENRELNRTQSILPDEKYRVYINPSDGQTYINAIRVDGYRKRDQFFVTQLPLPHTVKDFWQLVCEKSCKIIVQLGAAEDNALFYPTEAKQGYSYGEGTHTVTTQSVTQKGVLQIYQLEHAIHKRTMMKEPQYYREMNEVCLIKLPRDQYDHWSRTMSAHMISIVEEVVKLLQKQGDVNVLVVSRDGAEMCGLFICAFNCLESIRLTHEVEVYSQVLLAKYRRREFISNLNSYRHIYEILGAYVEQFSNYQNVSIM